MKPKKHALLTFCANALLLPALLWSAVLCFSTAFALDVDYTVLSAGLAVLGLASALLFSLPWKLRLPLAGAALLALGRGAWLLQDTLFAGQANIQCAVVNVYANAFPFIQRIYPIPQLTAAEWTRAVTLTVLAVSALLALFLGLMLVTLHSFWGTLILTGALVVPALFVTMTPCHLPLMVLLGGLCVLLLSSLTRRHDPAGSARLTLAAIPCVAGLLALLTALLPWRDYRQPQWAVEARQELVAGVSRVTSRLDLSGLLPGPFGSGGFTAAGSTSHISLSMGGQHYDGHTVLRVTTDYVGKLYLRGHSAAVYENNAWCPLDARAYDGLLEDGSFLNADLNPINLPAAALSGQPYYAVEVENVSAPGGCVYFPYNLLSSPSELRGAAFLDDSAVAQGRFVTKHTVYFRPNGGDLGDRLFRNNPSAFLAAYNYERFVYDNYQQLPQGYDDLLRPHVQAVLKLYYSISRFQNQPDTAPQSARGFLDTLDAVVPKTEAGDFSAYPIEMALTVAEYLDRLAVYDLDTPAVPAGEDFALYFLNDSHRGYCMHFASAAVLLLRAMDVPARYVSGYVTRTVVPGTINVADYTAHAWVEVYVENYGWYPVDVTPGYQGASLPWVEESAQPAPTPTPTPTPSAAPTPSAPQPSGAPALPPTPTPSGGARPNSGPDLKRLLLPAGIAGFAFLLVFIRYLAGTLRRRRFRQENPNRAAVALYRYALRLVRHGGTMPPQTEALAQKAAFSQNGLSHEEARISRTAVAAAVEALDRAAPWWKKLLLRWFWFLY
ncbi:transglutaminase domain-containing protein [Pseudoflavonifractor sp. 524-17]|uniref:transglutaminase-like domain-containing protein n=1 Tax=Pseudoflavonifractor sp. 524-17 TaxID=2304577 RepID=UPI00137AE911|nr:transglutaminase-like domain-containing protein [Pseudoflavonifractor sp. 524-17]NCE64729.1 transglutaminase domain-containing protein [Pseudoflavonifractor sp. 524-17]